MEDLQMQKVCAKLMLKVLTEAQKKPEIKVVFYLYHDNAPSHTALVTNYLTQNMTSVVPQAPYSPDLALSDFFVHPTEERAEGNGWQNRLRSCARGCYFEELYPFVPLSHFILSLENSVLGL
ncbi:hypothetical protein J6590_053273 [Homalodisca vitripennis]|nr:hypothetical protein J6590_053273 [Homalodisca vitripennis]